MMSTAYSTIVAERNMIVSHDTPPPLDYTSDDAAATCHAPFPEFACATHCPGSRHSTMLQACDVLQRMRKGVAWTMESWPLCCSWRTRQLRRSSTMVGDQQDVESRDGLSGCYGENKGGCEGVVGLKQDARS